VAQQWWHSSGTHRPFLKQLAEFPKIAGKNFGIPKNRLGALKTSGAPGLCPPQIYGCYATAPKSTSKGRVWEVNFSGWNEIWEEHFPKNYVKNE